MVLKDQRPCEWYYGLDGWVACGAHLWEGYREQRRRVGRRLVCRKSRDFR